MPTELPLHMWGSALVFHAVAFRGQHDALLASNLG